MKRSNLLLALTGIVILLVGSLVFGGLAFLRGAAGLLFVLLLPGWAITAALFSRHEFGLAERLALSIGFSIAVSILTGLALHLTPWGLQTGAWISLLAGISAIAGLVARTRRQPGYDDADSGTAGLQIVQIGFFALALLVAGLSLAIARRPAPASGFQGYTSFWIHPVRIDEGYAVQLGLSSMEFETLSYRIELQQDGRTVGEYPEITLSPGESTQVATRLDPEQVHESQVVALLFRLDDPDEPYRQVTWWPGDGLE
jgi:uncharacterized membrane protein